MREMKDSGIEWIGKVPYNWQIMPNKYLMKKIKDIIPIYNGENILSLTMNGVIIRDLDAGGKMPTTFDGYQKLYPNNLLMCLFDMDVTPRCIGLIKNSGISSPAYSQFKLNVNAYSNYYYYYYLMLDSTKELLHLAKNLRHSLTEGQLGEILTVVPPYDEQTKISKYIDDKSSKIDSLTCDIKLQIEKLEEYKKSIITEAVTKGLDPNVKMKDSGIEWIGEIPNDFTISKIKHICVKITDGTHGTFNRVSNGRFLLSAKNVFNNGIHIDESTESCISEHDYKSIISNGFPKKNDVLMCCVGTVGRTTVYELDEIYAFQRSVIFMRPSNKILSKMLMYSLQSKTTIYQENLKINKTAQEGIYQNSVKELIVSYPENIQNQEKIINYLDTKCCQINSIIDLKEQQLSKLEEYKKSLIYEYVTGKKEINNGNIRREI